MTHKIELPHLSMLLVKVPAGTVGIKKLDTSIEFKLVGYWMEDFLPPGQWQLLGVTPLSEEQAAKVVGKYKVYKNHLQEDQVVFTALESFHSLLTANNIAPTKRWAVLYHDKK